MRSFGLLKFVFAIFYSVKFENSPLFPAFTVVKSVQKQFSNNREINFKQLLKSVGAALESFSTKKYSVL